MKLLRIFIYLLIISSLYGCAKDVAPSGGPKDTTPPNVVEAMPPNNSTNFNAKVISITFDEYITLKNVKNKLMISPPFKEEPEITNKGKKVIIKLKEELKPNVTYNFYFDDAIVDYNEGNPIKNFSYIFSTGDFLDTLSFKGNIIDAYTLQPVEDCIIALYANLADSAFRTSVPYYITKTDKQGNFTFNYLQDTFYNIYALKDLNNSRTFDLITESIAFTDSVLSIKDSMFVNLKLFTEADTIQQIVDKKVLQLNEAQIVYKLPPTNPEIKFYNKIPEDYDIIFNKTKDTVKIRTKGADTLSVIAYDNSKVIDSLTVVVDSEKLRSKNVLTILPSFATKQYYKTELYLNFNNPIDTMFVDSIRSIITVDTIVDTTYFKILFTDSLNLNVKIDCVPEPKTKYAFYLADSSLIDIYGLYNKDFSCVMTTLDEDAFGGIIINIVVDDEHVGESFDVILDIVGKNNVAVESVSLHLMDSVQVKVPMLSPAEYSVRIVYDCDADGKWTTGDYRTKRQPERVEYPKKIAVKSKWEVEETIKIGTPTILR